MPTCNIDRFGQTVRFITGVTMFFAGTIMFVAGVPGNDSWWRVFQAVITLLGVFIMVEGVMGWCALRAMGFKTKF